ncbi:putative phage protein [Escherichia coli]|nr:putative phage protein [Escherichia coli]
MTTITKERLQWLANISGRDDIDDIDGGEIRELARIALASLEQNALSGNSPLIPGEVLSAIREVARIRADFDDFDGDRRGIGDCLDEAEQELIVTINKYASQLAVEPVVPAVLERLRTIVADPRALPRRKEWVSGQQYSYVLLENVEAMVDEACHAAMLQGSQPVSQTYNLPELIEGMEVSIDVSTCDADLGNRYFGTVTEALELDTAKNGYILLVQDAEPNFDINGNSPVTPDGWVIVPKEPTQAMIKAWLSEIANFRGHAAGYRAAIEAAPQLEVNRG